jgi:hypothetical protein
MMKKNRNVSVLTTYGDVEVASSRGTDKVETVLERMEKNIYSQAGTSGQIFNGSGSSLEDSLNNDLALMMYLANKQSLFITNTLNHLFSNGDIHFTYKIMPITLYNAASYVETSFKLLGSGYSALATSLGVGLSQRDIVNIKDLENDVLKLGDRLKPLATSYTQSGSDAKAEDGEEKPEDGKTPKDGNSQETPEEGGRPKKKESDKAEQTIKNEQSKERTEGGS